MTKTQVLQSELLVVFIDGNTRVFRNSPECRAAVLAWEDHDTLYCDGKIADDDYEQFTDYMEARGFPGLTTETVWLDDPSAHGR